MAELSEAMKSVEKSSPNKAQGLNFISVASKQSSDLDIRSEKFSKVDTFQKAQDRSDNNAGQSGFPELDDGLLFKVPDKCSN